MAGREIWWQGFTNLQDVLLQDPGLRMRPFADGDSEMLIVPSPLEDGRPRTVVVYLNGMVVEFGRLRRIFGLPSQWGSRRMSVGDLVALRELDALELYGPSYSPVPSDAQCGTLLLWSEAITGDVETRFDSVIRGVVIEEATETPVPGARVTIEPLGLVVSTDNGEFAVPKAPAAWYDVTVQVDTATWTTSVELPSASVQELVVGVAGRKLPER